MRLTWKEFKRQVEQEGMKDDDKVFNLSYERAPLNAKVEGIDVVVSQLPVAGLKAIHVTELSDGEPG